MCSTFFLFVVQTLSSYLGRYLWDPLRRPEKACLHCCLRNIFRRVLNFGSLICCVIILTADENLYLICFHLAVNGMASFEEAASPRARTDDCTKYPLRRIAPSIHKFIKILRIDLDRLHRHRLNISRVCSRY